MRVFVRLHVVDLSGINVSLNSAVRPVDGESELSYSHQDFFRAYFDTHLMVYSTILYYTISCGVCQAFSLNYTISGILF